MHALADGCVMTASGFGYAGGVAGDYPLERDDGVQADALGRFWNGARKWATALGRRSWRPRRRG